MKQELISVIMSVYNERPSWLSEAIESILSQTYRNIEFIIIIDDPANLVLIDMVIKYQEIDERIRYYINEKNMGLVFSLNRALSYCSGEFIARMDADDISHKDRFEKQLDYLIKNDLDLVGSNVNLFKNNNEIFYTTNKLLTHRYLKKMLASGTIGVVHPTFFGRNNVFSQLGGYHNALHAEDMEILARMFCNDFIVGNTKEVLLDYRYSEQSITKTNAVYTYKVSLYITKVFKEFLKSGRYAFDEGYHNSLKITQKEQDNFNKKQILMGEARKNLNDRKYIKFLWNILRAMAYSKSVFTSIRVNLMFRLYKIIENIELKGNG